MKEIFRKRIAYNDVMTSLNPPNLTPHYENFPVGSWLVPKAKRRHIHAIYNFARYADDIADEGNLSAQERIEQLQALKQSLIKATDAPTSASNIINDLHESVLDAEADLYRPYLSDLLDAFIQDSKNSASPGEPPAFMFGNTKDLMDYCRLSANPVGRMMLQLFDKHEAALLPYSDAICSGLQWVNFMQDVGIDKSKGRIYLPRDAVLSGNVLDIKPHEIKRQALAAKALLISGSPLINNVPWRLSLELRAILAGGVSLANKIIACEGRTLEYRPKLSWRDSHTLALAMLGRFG
jgi:hydroxysqualene synthase